MILAPLLNEAQNARRQPALDNLARVNRDDGLEPTILRMKVRRRVVVVVHRDDDSQESAILGQSISPFVRAPLVEVLNNILYTTSFRTYNPDFAFIQELTSLALPLEARSEDACVLKRRCPTSYPHTRYCFGEYFAQKSSCLAFYNLVQRTVLICSF